nr:alcohol dehydrogenase catalytic domain-containing protein [Paenibacillus sp.]
MRTIRFHEYGEPTDVLCLDEVAIPEPGPGRIRVRVRACGLNPVDWVTCQGHFAGQLPLPRGIGLDVAGIVDAIGEGVTDVAIGDSVLGAADFMNESSAGGRIKRLCTTGSACRLDSTLFKLQRCQWQSKPLIEALIRLG